MTPQLHFALWILLAVLVAAVVSFAATPLVKKLAVSVGAMDIPKDNRRMHKTPIPRLGGLAIFAAFVVSVLLFAQINREMRGIVIHARLRRCHFKLKPYARYHPALPDIIGKLL